ncbi:MAG: hypothetical protein ACO3U0_01820 [Ilumatobacteraceae bacterium]
MHPLEYLRAIARHHGGDGRREAWDLLSMVADGHFAPAEILVVGRRVVEHRGDAAMLRWVCAELVGAIDPQSRALDLLDLLAAAERGAPDSINESSTVDDSDVIVVLAVSSGGAVLATAEPIHDGGVVRCMPFTHLDEVGFVECVRSRRSAGSQCVVYGIADPDDGSVQPLPNIMKVGDPGKCCRPAPELLRRSAV